MAAKAELEQNERFAHKAKIATGLASRRARRPRHVRPDRYDARTQCRQAKSSTNTAAQAYEKIPDRQMNRIEGYGRVSTRRA